QCRKKRLAVTALPGNVRQGEQTLPHAVGVHHPIRHWAECGRSHLDLARASSSAMKSSSCRPPVASISRTCARNSSSSNVCRAHSTISGGIVSRGKGSDGLDESGFIGCSYGGRLGDPRNYTARVATPNAGPSGYEPETPAANWNKLKAWRRAGFP